MRSRPAEWSSSSMPSAAVAQKAPQRHTRKHSVQPMSRRVDPANPSLETHHLAGDPESRLAKANEGDSAPSAARPPSRRFVSSEPRIVGRIAGSSGLPAPPPGPPPRWIAADQPSTPSEPGDSDGPQQPKSRGWRFWRRRKNEISDEGTSAPGVADAGAPDPASDREAGLAAAFAAAFRPGPESPPTEANEDQPPPDAAPPPPAEPEPDGQLQPDADVDAQAAAVPADAAVAFAQADVDQADIEPTADAAIDEADIEPAADTESQPVAAEPEAVAAEAERQPEPAPEASVAPEAE